ncbi:MAG: flagellar biosynthetic protein FliO [Rhizomicrobium sp.]
MVFALKAGGGRWSFPRMPGARSRRLTILESLRLSHQVDLCIVACDGREILVAAHTQGVQLLQWLPPAGDGSGAEPPT